VGLIRWEAIERRLGRKIAEQLGEKGASVGEVDLGGLEVTVEWDRRSMIILTAGSGWAEKEGREGASLAAVTDACGGSRRAIVCSARS